MAPDVDIDFQPLEPILTSLVPSQTLRVELGLLHSQVLDLANIKSQEVLRVDSSWLQHRHLHPPSPTSTPTALCHLAGFLTGCREQVIREDLITINKKEIKFCLVSFLLPLILWQSRKDN